jgi:hypothetical protein
MPKSNQNKPKLTAEQISALKEESAKRNAYKTVEPFLRRLHIAINDGMRHMSFITDDNCSPDELMHRMKTALALSSSSGEIEDYRNEKVENMTLLLISKCDQKTMPKNEDDIPVSYVSICLYVPPSLKINIPTEIIVANDDGSPFKKIENVEVEVYLSAVLVITLGKFTPEVCITDGSICALDFSTDSNIKSADDVVSQFLAAVIAKRIFIPTPEDDDDDIGAIATNAGIEW